MPPHPTTSRWKRRLQNLSLFVGTFFLCVAVFEIVLRMNGYGNLEIYVPDQQLYWKLKPNQDCFTKVDHKPVHVNSHGTRGPEFETEKPAQTLRILSLGDSRTFGWGLADGETYSRQLERLLRKPGETRHVEVINAGVNAWSYPQMLVYFRDTALRYRPDVVVIGDANLWTQFSENNSSAFVKSFMRRVWLKNLLRRSAIYHYVVEIKLKSFYEQHRSKFIPVDPQQDTLFKKQQQNDPDAFFRSAIEGLCRLAQSNHVAPVLLFLPTIDDLAVTNSTVLKSKRLIHEKWNVPLVDMTGDVQSQGKSLYLEADSVHFGARANEMIAQRLYEAVTNLTIP